jgi:hypothetical protein
LPYIVSFWVCSHSFSPMRFKVLFFLLLIALAGCRPQSSPAATSEIWQVEVSPALQWLGPVFNSCALKQPGIGIILVQGTGTIPDFIFEWGPNTNHPGYTLQLGQDELKVVVNSSNPVGSLSGEDLISILNGRITDWSQVGISSLSASGIEVWANPPGDEAAGALAHAFPGRLTKNPFVSIAPDSNAMRQAVSGNPAAIGYLPGRWLDNSIKMVVIQGVQPELLTHPILVTLPGGEPQDAKKQWLFCLQRALN